MQKLFKASQILILSQNIYSKYERKILLVHSPSK